ncbi:MAG: hypothetical protein MUF48_15805 [Pirellulaceae bacterium]|nr:hypothetical protein [Pirellulaceae bacterium]
MTNDVPPQLSRVPVAVLMAILASLWSTCGPIGSAAEPPAEYVLHVPHADPPPTIDGMLTEACWQGAARTGQLKVTGSESSAAATEAYILQDVDHLYVGMRCDGQLVGHSPEGTAAAREFADLLIDSNGDRNSCYLIRIAPTDGGQLACAYQEHDPPWRDRTWQPPLKWAMARSDDGWTAELALPFECFCKNKTLAGTIGFNFRRFVTPGREVHAWSGDFDDPEQWGTLAGITPRDTMPAPDYVIPVPDPNSSGAQWGVTTYRPAPRARRQFLAEQQEQTLELGPGSAHPGTTGEVRLELEGFLLPGDPRSCGVIWDLVVNEQTGELYVLSDPRQVREAPDLRVFDRQGRYVRTIMPLAPTFPAASVYDLCGGKAREAGVELVIPKLYETLCGSLSLYGAYWHLPQKMVLAPDGDLLLSNIYRGTLWRLHANGTLPEEGWTSVYHHGRNEPFESHDWSQDVLNVQDLKNYLPFHALHYPYFCFDADGNLYVSAGVSSRPTRRYGYHWEVGQQEVTYQRELPGDERRTRVWKCRVESGVRLKILDHFGGMADPAGVVHDGTHLIVADHGHNRLLVLSGAGDVVATITHYDQAGQQHPLCGPTALAIDREKHLYVLLGSQPALADRQIVERTLAQIQQDYLAAAQAKSVEHTRLIKLQSWQQPRQLAESAPLHGETVQVAVDAGIAPPLVWVANGAGPGSLLQLHGDTLAGTAQWEPDHAGLTCPRQSGNQPILNIDPQTGDLFVEDHSNYRLKQHGTVFRIDQQGSVLQTWPPVFFNDLGLAATSPWWQPDFQRHFRYPDEPLFIDSIFGKDGRVYRWKLGKDGIDLLRCDRAGVPIPFAATGTNALRIDHAMQVNFWHDVCYGIDVDRHGNIYYAAKIEVEPGKRPVSAYDAVRRQIDVYNADGVLVHKGLLQLDAVRGIQVDDEGNLYVLHRPVERPWEFYLALSKFPPGGGAPLWSRRWDGYIGQSQVIFAPCHCILSRQHQTLDGKGYLYAAGVHSVQVIDCQTGQLVGEFGSYGNIDCQGPGSRIPHPELPLGIVSALSVWQDRLFVVDVLNRRIAKCRIRYGSGG